MTAAAWTVTPTLTPTPTATSTPTPTPTATATMTPFPVPAGWKGYTLSGFYVALPEPWKSVDVDRQGMDAILGMLKGFNTKWAQSVTSMFSSETLQKALKFWAMDTVPAGSGYASANVTFQSAPYALNTDDLCSQMPAAYRQLGVDVIDSQCGSRINEMDFDRFTTRLRAGAIDLKEFQYVFVDGRNLWSLTFSVDTTQWTEYETLFDTIAHSFRVMK